jgi:hypothetical protein
LLSFICFAAAGGTPAVPAKARHIGVSRLPSTCPGCKNYAALGGTLALPANRIMMSSYFMDPKQLERVNIPVDFFGNRKVTS